jgi:xylan 1,4-beta-xylosidase
MHVNFSCKMSSPSSTLPHYWEQCVGSGHATLALCADRQKQLTRCHKELGFYHVGIHSILSDDMGTLTWENNELVNTFFKAVQIFDFLLTIGMKAFVELSFVPTTLASGSDAVFHYHGNVIPPKVAKHFTAQSACLF